MWRAQVKGCLADYEGVTLRRYRDSLAAFCAWYVQTNQAEPDAALLVDEEVRNRGLCRPAALLWLHSPSARARDDAQRLGLAQLRLPLAQPIRADLARPGGSWRGPPGSAGPVSGAA